MEETAKNCKKIIIPIRDTLDAIGGKWRILIIVAIRNGYHRFKEIQDFIEKINPKVLANELKALEMNKLIYRKINDENSSIIEYHITEYSHTLEKLIREMMAWGEGHRKHLFEK